MSRLSGGPARGQGGRAVLLPRSVPSPSLGGQHYGCHWRRSGHGGAAPILLRFVPVRRPRLWPVRLSCARSCGFARLPRPRRGQEVGGAGARGLGIQLRPPFGHHGPFWGRRDAPLAAGGVEGLRPPGPQAGRQWGGEGRGGRTAVSLSSVFGGAARGPRPCPRSSPAQPPWVYTGGRAVVGAGRGPVGRRWVSAGGGGGGDVSSLRPAPLSSPGEHQGGLLRLHIHGRHHALAAHGAGAELPAGSGLCGSERPADRGRLARGCVRRGCGVPPLGAAAPPGGCGAAVSLAGPQPPGLVPYAVHERVPSANAYRLVLIPHSTSVVQMVPQTGTALQHARTLDGKLADELKCCEEHAAGSQFWEHVLPCALSVNFWSET